MVLDRKFQFFESPILAWMEPRCTHCPQQNGLVGYFWTQSQGPATGLQQRTGQVDKGETPWQGVFMWWQFQSSGQRCSCGPNHNKLNLTTAYNANGVSSNGLDRATALGTKASKGHFIQQLTLSLPIVKEKCIGTYPPITHGDDILEESRGGGRWLRTLRSCMFFLRMTEHCIKRFITCLNKDILKQIRLYFVFLSCYSADGSKSDSINY